MKAAALYHLLQIRARKLEEGADAATTSFLRDVQQSLSVTYADSAYLLAWSHASKPYRLTVAGDAFGFYVAGDTSAAQLAQRDRTGLRSVNWSQAATVWKDVALASGVQPRFPAGDELGLSPSTSSAAPLRALILAAPAAVLSIGLLITGSPIESGVTALLSTALAAQLCSAQPRGALTLPEAIIVSIVSALPLGYGLVAPVPVLFAGLVTLGVAERMTGLWSPLLWVFGGAVLGFSVPAGVADAAAAVVFVATIVCATLMAPNKLPRTQVAYLGIGLVAGFVVTWLAFGVPDASAVAVSDALRLAAAGLGAALMVGFLLWPIHGVLFRIVPWLSVFALGVFAVASALVRDPAPAFSATAIVAFLAVRISRSSVAFKG
jgi:hypothetical protein